jgi:heterodisulfide reductase subunit A-like polyferredoxin
MKQNSNKIHRVPSRREQPVRVERKRHMSQSPVSGSVLVVGGGIAGMQAALDLADSGYLVHLVEKSSAIGGVMSELDKTFPTNDCSM